MYSFECEIQFQILNWPRPVEPECRLKSIKWIQFQYIIRRRMVVKRLAMFNLDSWANLYEFLLSMANRREEKGFESKAEKNLSKYLRWILTKKLLKNSRIPCRSLVVNQSFFEPPPFTSPGKYFHSICEFMTDEITSPHTWNNSRILQELWILLHQKGAEINIKASQTFMIRKKQNSPVVPSLFRERKLSVRQRKLFAKT